MANLGPTRRYLNYTRNKFGAIAFCDQSGQAYMHSKRVEQTVYAGYTEVGTGELVNPKFFDIPNPQSMPPPIYRDPKPVLFSRPQAPQAPSPIQIYGGGTYVDITPNFSAPLPVLVNTNLSITSVADGTALYWNFSGGTFVVQGANSTALDFIGIQSFGDLIVDGNNLYFLSHADLVGTIDPINNGTLGLPLQINITTPDSFYVSSNGMDAMLKGVTFATMSPELNTRALEYVVSIIPNADNGGDDTAYSAPASYSATSISYVNVLASTDVQHLVFIYNGGTTVNTTINSAPVIVNDTMTVTAYLGPIISYSGGYIFAGIENASPGESLTLVDTDTIQIVGNAVYYIVGQSSLIGYINPLYNGQGGVPLLINCAVPEGYDVTYSGIEGMLQGISYSSLGAIGLRTVSFIIKSETYTASPPSLSYVQVGV